MLTNFFIKTIYNCVIIFSLQILRTSMDITAPIDEDLLDVDPWVILFNLSLSFCYVLNIAFIKIKGSMRAVPIPESPSPPPPPPPPRPTESPNSTPSHSQNNQSTNSANDSKESNELSEAECDRDPLIRNRNSVGGGGAAGMSTEEMRRLIEKYDE
jgi:hypothetical protein